MEVTLDDFDARAYLREFFGVEAGMISFDARLLLHYSSRLIRSHDLQGARVLSLGSGPSLCEVLCLAGVAGEIHMSDISAANRDALARWANPGPDGFDWTPLIAQALAEERNLLDDVLAGDAFGMIDADAVARRRSAVRDRVTQVLPCDISRADPLGGQGFPHYDVVASLFAVDAASRDITEWAGCFRNACELVVPGGLLFFGTSLESDRYSFGSQVYETACVSKSMLLDHLAANGFTLVPPAPVSFTEHDPQRLYAGGLYLTARKTERTVGT